MIAWVNDVAGFECISRLSCTKHLTGKPVWSLDGTMVATATLSGEICIWANPEGALVGELSGRNHKSSPLLWSPSADLLAISDDNDVRIMEVHQQETVHLLRGHLADVTALAWSPDGGILATGSDDCTVILWDAISGTQLRIQRHHSKPILGLAWSASGQFLASCSQDSTVRVAQRETGDLVWTHRQPSGGGILAVSWSPNGAFLAVALPNATIQVLDTDTGRPNRVLEGHLDEVIDLSFSTDSRLLASSSRDGTIRLWTSDPWAEVVVSRSVTDAVTPPRVCFSTTQPELAMLAGGDGGVFLYHYRPEIFNRTVQSPVVERLTAKVVVLGESGVGKSALTIRIATGEFRRTQATHAAAYCQIPVPASFLQEQDLRDFKAELAIWDLAGQGDYEIVHQLFLDNTEVALLVSDCSDHESPFRGVAHWAKVLRKLLPETAKKFLVTARVDVAPPCVDEKYVATLLRQYGLQRHFRTSAWTGEGVSELFDAICRSVDWPSIPRITSPALFRALRELLFPAGPFADAVVSLEEIAASIQNVNSSGLFRLDEIDVAIKLFETRGLIYRLEKDNSVLRRPDLMTHYASSVLIAARNHPLGLGAVPERDVLCSEIPFTGFARAKPEDERKILVAAVDLLISRDLCFREIGLLVFPSQLISTPATLDLQLSGAEAAYRFSGAVESVFATLVVRLSYTGLFRREQQWRNAAEFSMGSSKIIVALGDISEGTGTLEIRYPSDLEESARQEFGEFVLSHLQDQGTDVDIISLLACPRCKHKITDTDAVASRLQHSLSDIPCQYCGTSIVIQGGTSPSQSDRPSNPGEPGSVSVNLSVAVAHRKATELQEFDADLNSYSGGQVEGITILHISDIHLGTEAQARKYRMQLEADLKRELGIRRLDYLLISGDLADHATPEEFDAAFLLIDGIAKRFGLDPGRIVVVPGNHDVNWDSSEASYAFVPARKLRASPSVGTFIPAGDSGILQRDNQRYKDRFAYFSEAIYQKIYGRPYPLEYDEQAVLHPRADDRLLFLALNSCWEIDHHYTDRASLHIDALTFALDQINSGSYEEWLKIAIWHHPLGMMVNEDHMELLAVAGFQVCLHGHIHEATERFYRYDSQRNIHLISAGSFGAPVKELPGGIPLQYNLLLLDRDNSQLTVNTRKKEKPDGAWSADSRWGSKSSPKPYYRKKLKGWR